MLTHSPLMTWKEERQRNIAAYRNGWAAYMSGKPKPPVKYCGPNYRAGWRAARNFMATWEADKVMA
jgi:hypothetical protein